MTPDRGVPAPGMHRRFLARLAWGALWRRRSRLVIALAAVAVGSSVAAGLGLVARDVDRQVARELMAFGPNVLVVPAGDASGRSKGHPSPGRLGLARGGVGGPVARHGCR